MTIFRPTAEEPSSLTNPPGIFHRVIEIIQENGFRRFTVRVIRRLFRVILPPVWTYARLGMSLVKNARGLEVGGPSPIFSRLGPVPVYYSAQQVDGLNFSAETIWATKLGENEPYRFGNRILGRQFIREASDFPDIESGSYEFVLSSHVVEHLANPLRALLEWRRVLREDGVLILVAPHKEATFDNARPVTSIEHILDDYRRNTGEDDMTHIPEVLELHDFIFDPWVKEGKEFRTRCENNPATRGVHHHVFDTETLVRLVDLAQYQILSVEHALPESVVIVCVKPKGEDGAENSEFLDESAKWRETSPFKSDLAD